MSKTVIVTGGCGYIGSHVARAFKNRGDCVYIIDRVLRDHTLKNMDGWFIDDFASDASLATMFDLTPDIIVHCAGTSLVGPSMTNPSEYYNNNVSKTIRMMDTIKDWQHRPTIMFSSSASVYGEPKHLPISEFDSLGPVSPYGSTKLTDEMILRDYGAAYGIDAIIFRYFNACGAEPFNYDLGQEPGATHIVARALEAAISNTVFTINGNDFPTPDSTCVRDYVHVWDIARAHVMASDWVDQMDADPRTIRTSFSRIFNLGTNTGISNREIADYVLEKYDLSYAISPLRRPGDPAELVADASQANNELGWTPEYSTLPVIIDSAYKWYTRGV